MGQRDLHDNIDERNAFDTQLVNSATTTVGEIIDTAGYESIEFIMKAGVVTAGDITPILEDGDNVALSDAAVVTSDFRLGSLVALAATNAITRFGYVGKKRYVRFSALSDGTTNLTVGAIVVLGHPHSAPVAQ